MATATSDKKSKVTIKSSARSVIYPKVCVGTVNPVEITPENTVVTAALARKLLGWETEEQYKERKLKANPKAKEKEMTFGDKYLLLDLNDNKVQCWSNLQNRRLRPAHVKSLAQDVLNGKWKFNGEALIVGKTGMGLSVQHRLIALVLAAQEWAGPNKQMWLKKWPTEPVIHALLITGIEEDAETINTLDNVLARNLEDVFQASGLFKEYEGNPKAMAECSRMAAKAVDLLWLRLNCHDDGQKYQTHSASADWLERHPKLLKSVKFIRDANQERQLSSLKVNPHKKEEEEGADARVSLSAGECAAMLYLMAQSQSDYDNYRNADVKGDKALDLGLWDRACEYWLEMKDSAKALQPVRDALAALIDLEGSRSVEKRAVLALAWKQYLGKHRIAAEHLKLKYVENETTGVMQLAEPVTFEGADQGDHPPGSDAKDPPPEAVEEATVDLNGYRIVEEDGVFNVYHEGQDNDKPLSSHRTEQKAEAWVQKELVKVARREEMKEKLLENRAAKKNGKKIEEPAAEETVEEETEEEEEEVEEEEETEE